MALGIQVVAAASRPDELAKLAALNTAVDLGDAAAAMTSIVTNQEGRRAAFITLLPASLGAVAWLRLRRNVSSVALHSVTASR